MSRQQQVTMLPKAVKAWRKERKMSQAALGAGAEVSEGLIAQIETNRRQPGLTNALAIARTLGVELEAIAIVHVDLTELTEAVS